MFDIARDNELIAAGNSFWCSCCCTSLPIAKRAAFDSPHCHDCAAILRQEKNERKNADPVRWSPGGQVCIIDGRGYKVTDTGRTVCVGPVDENGKSRSMDGVVNRSVSVSANDSNGAKIIHDKGHGGNDSHVQAPVIFAPKKTRGRPRKTGDVSRWTRNRRVKQTVMEI